MKLGKSLCSKFLFAVFGLDRAQNSIGHDRGSPRGFGEQGNIGKISKKTSDRAKFPKLFW